MIEADEVVEKIKASIPDATVEIEDLTGTRDHYQVLVVSEQFDGKPLIKRHRRVQNALSEELEGPIHALKLETKTPEEV